MRRSTRDVLPHHASHAATASGITRRTILASACALPLTVRAAAATPLVDHDTFHDGLARWQIECERPGHIAAQDGVLDIDVPAGATLWFKRELVGPVEITYRVTPVSRGGPNDRVSDVNCFWMARDPGAADGSVLTNARTGAFADYDRLETYYAGIGGNANTTTRFRRYVGTPGVRPLLPQHDLHDPSDLLQPNKPFDLCLIADGRRIALLRDGRPVFTLNDDAPYRRGHFGLRTTQSHLRVERFQVRRL